VYPVYTLENGTVSLYPQYKREIMEILGVTTERELLQEIVIDLLSSVLWLNRSPVGGRPRIEDLEFFKLKTDWKRRELSIEELSFPSSYDFDNKRVIVYIDSTDDRAKQFLPGSTGIKDDFF
jgi:hypothetical protein